MAVLVTGSKTVAPLTGEEVSLSISVERRP